MSENEEKKLDFKSFETHSLKEVMGNAKLLEAKAKQLRDFAVHFDLAKTLNKDRPDMPHIMIEAWQFAGFLCQVRGGNSDFELVEGAPIETYKGYAEIVNADGEIVASATALCDRGESNWKTRNSYAIASMAATRAQGKAWRMVLGFLVLMAGYSATPWEEMVGLEDETSGQYQRQRPNAGKVANPETISGMTMDQFGNWTVTMLNREGILKEVGDISEFVKRALAQANIKWETAQKVQLEKAVMEEIERVKTALAKKGQDAAVENVDGKEPAVVDPAKPTEAEDMTQPEHGMTMDQFGLWTQGLMDSIKLKIADMSPKGISQFIKMGLEYAKLDWYTSSEEDLKAGIREYAEKVVEYAKEDTEKE